MEEKKDIEKVSYTFGHCSYILVSVSLFLFSKFFIHYEAKTMTFPQMITALKKLLQS